MTHFPTDAEIINAAKQVETMSQLWKAFPQVRDFQAIRTTCARLGIKLDLVRKNRSGSREALPHPKPAARTGKPKKGDEK